jgi:microcompartment protein CcmK/EutM
MNICRVLAPVVSTVKHPSYEGQRLLAVRVLEADLSDTDQEFLAIDRVQAGEGDIVLVMSEGNGVRQLMNNPKLPIRSLIVGIIDEVDTP